MDGYVNDVDSFFAALRYILKNPPDFDVLVDSEEAESMRQYLISMFEKWMRQAFKEGFKSGSLNKASESMDPGIVDYHVREAAEQLLNDLAGSYKKEVHYIDGTVK